MVARRLALVTVAAVAALVLALPAGAAPAAAAPAATSAQPGDAPFDPPPPGANDWSCRPSAKHPEPVVLAHGLSANQSNNWQYMAPVLKREGYCVFSLTYGRSPLAPPPLSQIGGLTVMELSAVEFRAFVERVRAVTGAEKVDILGHSEGSLMPNQYVKFLGGAEQVKRYVGLAPLWDGTRLLGASDLDGLGRRFGLDGAYGPALASLCASCRQFLRGSAFLERMNSGGGPRVNGVDYTMIMTRYDELVVPYTSGELEGADNVVVQDVCPTDAAEHVGVAFDPVTAQIVLNALDPDRERPVRCAGPA